MPASITPASLAQAGRRTSALVGLLLCLMACAAFPALGAAETFPQERIPLTLEERKFVAEHPVVTFSGAAWEPLAVIEDGRYEGMFRDYYDLLEKKTGLAFRFAPIGTGTDFQEALDALEDKRIDMIDGAGKTRDGSRRALFAGPFFRCPLAMAGRENALATRIEELFGKRAVVARGSTASEYLKETYPELPLILVEDPRKALAMVASGQADAMLDNLAVVGLAIRRQGLTNVKASGLTERALDIFSLVRSDLPILRDILEKAHESIGEREIEAIHDKWLPAPGQSRAGKALQLTAEEDAFLRGKGAIRMCVDPNWMPFERITFDGRHEGMAADYLRLLAGRLGARLELVPTRDWVQTLEKARAGQCDIVSGIARTPSRLQYLSFTKPYLVFPHVIATRSDQLFIENFDSVLDKPIGVIRNYSVEEVLRAKYPGARLIEVDDANDGLRRVAAGKLFGFVDTVAAISFAIRQENLLDLKIAGRLDDVLEISVAAPKDQPLLLSAFDKAVDSITQEERNDIYKRWIAITFEQPAGPSIPWKYLVAAILVFAAGASWNRKLAGLNRRIRQANVDLALKSQELERLSTTDCLTGASNRRKLEEVLELETQRSARYARPLALILLDIDHFKKINDAYGHAAGDAALAELTRRLQRLLRSTDVLGRWGGEEFLIVCPETNFVGAKGLAEKLRSEIADRPFEGAGAVTASFGVAAFQMSDSPRDLVKRADESLYRAKAAGRNAVA